ncbi:repressor protein CI [Yersinia massiliensis]|uniref:XRE family transcriptional regulator n=1 Tax=Yersinia massiliensis TaxID=419257 RepID=UPI0005E1401B|nr:helix-turn-helix transcriptional regulator [Yersinia massiliensis]CNI74876.1 repressor protein CI [Yersinia massiliensis]
MDFSERLNLAMAEGRFTQGSLAKAVGMAQSSIWKLTSGGAKGSRRTVDIARVLGVRPEWLSNGSGPMREDGAKPHHPDSTIPPESEWAGVEVWDSSTPLGEDDVEIPYYKSIELAAGNGCSNNEDHNGFKLRFSKTTLRRAGADPKSVMAFPVHGNSMEPVLPDGTTVTVDCANNRIVDGAIYAIDQDEFFRVKLLYRLPGRKLSIRSYNKDEFPDEEADMDDVKIIGRVIHYSVMLV